MLIYFKWNRSILFVIISMVTIVYIIKTNLHKSVYASWKQVINFTER